MKEALQRLRKLDAEEQVLAFAASVLRWDQETFMPRGAIEGRAEQLACMQSLVHERASDPERGELLARLGVSRDNPMGSEDLTEEERAFLRVTYRQYERNVMIPNKLVVALAKATSKGQARWAEARRLSDFSFFLPSLKEILGLTVEMARHLGYEENPYDGLLDEFEPWMTAAQVQQVFEVLRRDLVDLSGAIGEAGQVDDRCLRADYPVAEQDRFGRMVVEKMGYDFNCGRMDISTHPFTTTLGPNDVRFTTRYRADALKAGLFANIHECGHALYEMGIDGRLKGSALGKGASLGIHESQSRLWENMVGRGVPFWKHFFPLLQRQFPSQLGQVSGDDFHRAINKVEPSLIRVEADEVHYGLHVILRFRLEKMMVEGTLPVEDLPEAWEDNARELLGVAPSNHQEGVLQDVHWSMGAFGYFPTYALGNLYAAHFMQKMREEVVDMDRQIETGNLQVVLEWLRHKVHRHGFSLTAGELLSDVCGEELSHEPFVRYLREKYSEIYNLT